MSAEEKVELDAFIAEHVMGKKVHKGDKLLFGHPAIGYDDFIYSTGKYPDVRMWCGEQSLSWRPTTNDADAMEVLKVCAEKSHDPIQINKHHCYWAVFTIDVGPARSETLPEAICLFAKRLFQLKEQLQ